MSKPTTLNGKTIVITGASSGFGRGSAEQLASEGANVVLAARRTDLIDNLAAESAARGGQCFGGYHGREQFREYHPAHADRDQRLAVYQS